MALHLVPLCLLFHAIRELGYIDFRDDDGVPSMIYVLVVTKT